FHCWELDVPRSVFLLRFEKLPTSNIERMKSLHPHDLIAAIDVYDLTGDCGSAVAREKDTGPTELGGIAASLERRAFLIMFQHRHETADAARGQRVHRSGGNAVDANFSRTEIVSEITRARFQARFRHAHHVVMRHHFFGAVISHRDNAPAVGHYRS